MNYNSYTKYNHKKGRWERRYPRTRRYNGGYVSYPQYSGGRRGGKVGLFGAIVIILFVGLNLFSFFSWYFR